MYCLCPFLHVFCRFAATFLKEKWVRNMLQFWNRQWSYFSSTLIRYNTWKWLSSTRIEQLSHTNRTGVVITRTIVGVNNTGWVSVRYLSSSSYIHFTSLYGSRAFSSICISSYSNLKSIPYNGCKTICVIHEDLRHNLKPTKLA